MSKHIVRLLTFVGALMLAAFALSAGAATKFISLTVPTGPLAAGPQQIVVTVTNGGNSNANSFEIDWIETGGFTVQGGSLQSDGTPGAPVNPGVFGQPYKGLVWNKQAPAKTFVNIVLNVTVTPTSCGGAKVPFEAAAWTGSPGPLSTAFPMNPAGPIYTSIAAAASGCTLQFSAQPQGAQVSTNITSVGSNPAAAPVAVAMYNGANIDTTFTGPITLVIKSGTGGFPGNNATLSSGGPNNAVNGVATFPGLQINQAGMNYQLTASAPTSSASNVDSSMFSIFANGNIGCVSGNTIVGGVPQYNNYNSSLGPKDFTYDPDGNITPSDTGGNWGLRRGANKDDTPCVLVDYTFTPPTTMANGKVASFFYDQSTGQAASWKYLLTWGPFPVDSSGSTKGWTGFRPLVSWGIPNPDTSIGSPDFTPALFCTTDPGDITKLNAAGLAALLPNMPDDCVNLDGSPNAGDGPFCKAFQAHPAIYPRGGKAKVCVSQQGASTGGANKIYPWTEFVDQEDSVVIGR